MEKINVAFLNPKDNYKQIMVEHDGEIYKGFGIVSWVSSKSNNFYLIHLNTGRIIPTFITGDIEAFKLYIDSIENFSPNMSYDEILDILNIKR